MTTLQIVPIQGISRITPGDSICEQILASSWQWPDGGARFMDGDVLVVTSKIVAKAEGRIVHANSREEAIDSQTIRIVATKVTPRGVTRIVQTEQGLVMAAAGVDASNVEEGSVVLLPVDPDASARALMTELRSATGARLGVIVTDTMGRPWRLGVTDVGIGAAGIDVLDDHTGRVDGFGRTLEMTIIAIADEIAAAADLVKGKIDGSPVAIVRGMGAYVTDGPGPGALAVIRPIEEDLFSLGTAEAIVVGAVNAAGNRRTVRAFTSSFVPDEPIRRAIDAALTAPAPHHTTPWRFMVLREESIRYNLLDAMRERWLADLAGTPGMTAESATTRVRRGEILRQAPVLVLGFIDLAKGAHTYPDAARNLAERDLFMVAGGAAMQNLMITLAADGLGSAWISSTIFCPDVVREILGLSGTYEPLGALAIGHAAVDPPERTPRQAVDFILPPPD